ncbi:MAG: transmembrane transport protein [Acidobacteriota bacterium]
MTSAGNSPQPIPDPRAKAALHRLVAAELSLPSRLGYVALLLAASMMTTVIGALWITEPALRPRTQLAFAVMMVIGLAWVVFAIWALTHRRPLLAGHAIVAGRLALTFTSLFLIGAAIAARTAGGVAPYVAAGVGVMMVAAAAGLLWRAHATSTRLLERRAVLEREIGTKGR